MWINIPLPTLFWGSISATQKFGQQTQFNYSNFYCFFMIYTEISYLIENESKVLGFSSTPPTSLSCLSFKLVLGIFLSPYFTILYNLHSPVIHIHLGAIKSQSPLINAPLLNIYERRREKTWHNLLHHFLKII